MIRILLQSLSDLGYHGAAKHLSEESGYELEIPSAAAFRNAVMRGEWEEAEGILLGNENARELDGGGVMLGNGHSRQQSWSKSRLSVGSQNGVAGSGPGARAGLPLAEGADTTYLKFLLRQQKYLELLEDRDLNTALSVLRNELAPPVIIGALPKTAPEPSHIVHPHAAIHKHVLHRHGVHSHAWHTCSHQLVICINGKH